MTDEEIRQGLLGRASRLALRRSDVASCAMAASSSIDAAHVEAVGPGRFAVEPFAFYDEPVPAEALAAASGMLREHMPPWLLAEVRPCWRHVPAEKPA